MLVVVGVEVEAISDGINDRPEKVQHVRLFNTDCTQERQQTHSKGTYAERIADERQQA